MRRHDRRRQPGGVTGVPRAVRREAPVSSTAISIDALGRFLAGGRLGDSDRPTAAAVVTACAAEQLEGLLHARLSAGVADGEQWAADICERVARDAGGHAAIELLRRQEILAVFDALAAEQIVPVLLKGTALAYTVYPTPGCRPRSDTDLMIQR